MEGIGRKALISFIPSAPRSVAPRSGDSCDSSFSFDDLDDPAVIGFGVTSGLVIAAVCVFACGATQRGGRRKALLYKRKNK